MAFDFPTPPIPGQTYTPAGGKTYVWDGVAWRVSGAGLTTSVIVSDGPPGNVPAGTLWWEADTGNTFIFYDDGDSKQWVQFNVTTLPQNALTSVVTTVVTSSATYTKPANLKFLGIEVQGGGGAGGGNPALAVSQGAASGGGGSGGYTYSFLPASSIPASVAMTIGAAGAPLLAGAGGAGGNSGFGLLGTGNGGTGGSMTGAVAALTYASPGSGGGTANGQININGQRAQNGTAYLNSASFHMGGSGGSSLLGLAGGGLIAGTSPGMAATGFGAGGSGSLAGASQPASAGGAGGPGVVILTEYF